MVCTGGLVKFANQADALFEVLRPNKPGRDERQADIDNRSESGGEYEAEEGCLSLMGTRKTKRYDKITVRFENAFGQKQMQQFSGWTAQIIQHEIDHCNGILI